MRSPPRLFFIDIILNFRTAYKDPNDIWVTSSGKIACNYLQTWFVVDFLSTFPIGALIQSPAADGRVQLGQASGDAKVSISTTSINKLIRLIRIVKLGRLFKLSNSMPALQRYDFNPDHIRIEHVRNASRVCELQPVPLYEPVRACTSTALYDWTEPDWMDVARLAILTTVQL